MPPNGTNGLNMTWAGHAALVRSVSQSVSQSVRFLRFLGSDLDGRTDRDDNGSLGFLQVLVAREREAPIYSVAINHAETVEGGG